MDKIKAKRAKMDICEIMEDVNKEDWRDPQTTEHLKNLAKLYGFYEAECLKSEYMGSSMRMGGMSYAADDGRGGMGMDNRSMRGGSYSDSGASSASYGNSYAGRDQLRQLMQDPTIGYEAKEYLRKAMEVIR